LNLQTDRILIYRLGSLGDTIIALPCFNKVREVYPNSEIILLTNKPVMAKAAPLEAVLGSEYFFDKVLAYPVGTRNLFVLFSLLRKLRSYKVHTVINLSAARSKKAALRDKWFFRVAGVKQLIGFPTEDKDFKIAIDPLTGDYEWEADRLARRIKAIGNITLNEDRYWDLRLTSTEINKANEVLNSFSPGKPIIAICAGTKMQSKDWEENNWIDLIKRLRVILPDGQLVIVGAPEEADRAENCLKVWGTSGINLCGKTSPRVSAAVLKQANIFIGHDSGPMHLAACVGTPCVAIFSSRNLPRQWYPRGGANKIIRHKTACEGCSLEVCIVEKKRCVLSITVDEVLNAVAYTLNIDIKDVVF
jgi:heptosyltransferase-3